MMNHFLSERGRAGSSAASSGSAAGSSASICTGVESSSGSISSGMIVAPLLGKRIEQFLNRAADNGVHHGEIGREGEHRDNHHQRGGSHLLPGRPGDALHFEMQLLEIILR